VSGLRKARIMRQVCQNNQIAECWGTMAAEHPGARRAQGQAFLIIDRYISWEIIRPFCAGLGLLILVFVGYSAAMQLGLAAQGQLDMVTAFKLIALSTLVTLEVLLPSALFFSVLAAIGRLYRDAEMSALYAAGISQTRILESVLKLSLLIAVITGIISIEGRPWAYRESYRLEAQAAAEFDLKKMATGEFATIEGSSYTFIAQGLDLEQGLHTGVFLQKNHREGRVSEIIIAESAALPVLNPGQALTAEFFNGYNYLLDNRESRDVTLKFKHMKVHLPNQEAQERYRRKAETTLNLSRSRQPKDIAEYQWRLTTPLATVLLALIAVPLGRSAPREPRLRSFFIALAMYIGLFSMTSVMRTWIEQERMPASPGLWLAYAIMAAVLLLLVYPPRWRLAR
jgi:lipopolysaccharide export system permease protein